MCHVIADIICTAQFCFYRICALSEFTKMHRVSIHIIKLRYTYLSVYVSVSVCLFLSTFPPSFHLFAFQHHPPFHSFILQIAFIYLSTLTSICHDYHYPCISIYLCLSAALLFVCLPIYLSLSVRLYKCIIRNCLYMFILSVFVA